LGPELTSSGPGPDPEPGAAATSTEEAHAGANKPGGRPERGQREELLRAELEPLGEDEWPRALLVAIAVCVLLAIAVIVGAASVHNLSRHGGSLPGGAFLALVLLALALGMYRHRYWAVLGFEALLAFQIIVTSLALVVASTLLAAVICVVSVGLGGWLFWKLIRVMGRIQAGEGRLPA
jgi:hypothetical protein